MAMKASSDVLKRIEARKARLKAEFPWTVGRVDGQPLTKMKRPNRKVIRFATKKEAEESLGPDGVLGMYDRRGVLKGEYFVDGPSDE